MPPHATPRWKNVPKLLGQLQTCWSTTLCIRRLEELWNALDNLSESCGDQVPIAALAALAATASFAQSSVTLFGGADLGLRSVTTGANKFTGMSQDGIYSSRFGVNGVEDLGGGLKANFHFEGGMNPDVGTAAGFNFTRKSTIGLAGGFGEVRFGRDYTPLFTVAGIADPFGTNGVGSSYNLANGVTQVIGKGTQLVVDANGAVVDTGSVAANAGAISAQAASNAWRYRYNSSLRKSCCCDPRFCGFR